MSRKSPQDRFWVKVEKTDNCWNWKGYRNPRGYGRFLIKNPKIVLAHRASYFFENGEFDLSLYVCHHCDNPSCVRPDHLFLGTQLDNLRDMVKKGRYKANATAESWVRGSRVGGAKLVEGKVFQLRRIRLMGCGVKRMAQWLSMDRTSIQDMLHGRTWAHVPFPRHESDVSFLQ